jgi:hypothetical protein
MRPPYIRTGSSEEAESYAKSRGNWVVANLQQSIGWTQKPITVEYGGRTFLLLPEDDQHFPAIAMLGEPEPSRRAILEFASALSWSKDGAVTVEHWTGGGRPHRAGKRPAGGQVSAMFFHISYLPTPTEANQKLALALFQEGAGLMYTHVAYAFLSFYKIINLVSGHTGKQQIAWINAHVGAMNHHRAKDRLTELQSKKEDIGTYLYQSCRCAIAHAGDPRNPVIDPHNPDDERRLSSDMPMIITLAEIAIEEIGIQTSQTVHREHRYELSGFEDLLTTDLVKMLKAGETPKDREIGLPDHISLRMWGHATYAPLEGMKPEMAYAVNGVATIRCKSQSAGYFANVKLDFPNYRLNAEVFGEGLKDDGSAEFIEDTMEIERFFWDWNGNGCLEVWASGNTCLGRCDPFLPVNVMLDHKAYEKRVEELKAEIARRPRRSSNDADAPPK